MNVFRLNPFRLVSAVLLLLLAASPATAQVGRIKALPEVEYRLSLSPDGYGEVFGLRQDGIPSYRLPRFKIFAGSGELLLDIRGQSSDFKDAIRAALAAPQPQEDAPSLTQELAHVANPEADPEVLEEIREADFVFVEYGATWCQPCRVQKRDAEAIRQENPELEIVLLPIEADVAKLDPETQSQLFGNAIRPTQKP